VEILKKERLARTAWTRNKDGFIVDNRVKGCALLRIELGIGGLGLWRLIDFI